MTEKPEISWDLGSGYDLFISLLVLHDPSTFGLRPSWAAGVRSRLSPGSRDVLDQAQKVCSLPLYWITTLPEPKDTEHMLSCLKTIPPEERLTRLTEGPVNFQAAHRILKSVAQKQGWHHTDKLKLREAFRELNTPPNSRETQEILNIWKEPALFGEKLLDSLYEYQKVS